MTPKYIALTALAVLALATPVLAQTLSLAADLSLVPGSFNYGPVITHRVDEDGDGVADSFLQQGRLLVAVDFVDSGITIVYPHYRLVRVVNGQVCRGAWLNLKQLAGVTGTWNSYYARVDLVQAGVRQELQVSYDTDATSNVYQWRHIKAFSIDRVWVGCQ